MNLKDNEMKKWRVCLSGLQLHVWNLCLHVYVWKPARHTDKIGWRERLETEVSEFLIPSSFWFADTLCSLSYWSVQEICNLLDENAEQVSVFQDFACSVSFNLAKIPWLMSHSRIRPQHIVREDERKKKKRLMCKGHLVWGQIPYEDKADTICCVLHVVNPKGSSYLQQEFRGKVETCTSVFIA